MDVVSLFTLTIINVENQDILVYVNRFANMVMLIDIGLNLM